MGRKVGMPHINSKKTGAFSKPCMKEMIVFLGCLSLNHNNDEKCVRKKDLLTECVASQNTNSRKPWGSINYQLHRLSRGRK